MTYHIWTIDLLSEGERYFIPSNNLDDYSLMEPDLRKSINDLFVSCFNMSVDINVPGKLYLLFEGIEADLVGESPERG